MIKTFNRTPIAVNTPDDKNVKNYFFNHYNWKGLCDDKNILAVDQETFADCNNVYVDSEGLLRSRPSLKITTVTYKNGGKEYTLSDILDVWTFNDVTVYLSASGEKYYVTFVNKNVKNHIQKELTYVDDNGETHSYSKIKPILADNKIFIFSEHDFNYYDIEKNIYATAIDFIYVPTTSQVYGNKTTELDSPNVLTNSYITKYLYDKTTNINFADLVGKKVIVKVDGVSYEITFEYNNELVFVERYSGLGENNFSTNNALGEHAFDIPLVQASERQSTLVCSYERVYNGHNISAINWTIYHTLDGITFTLVPSKSKILGMPKISRDGFYAFVFCEDGPWVYSLLDTTGSTTGTKKYNVWTNLLKTINETKYNEWLSEGFNLNKHNSNGGYFNQTISVNGYFRDDRIFAFTYGDGLANTYDDPQYKNFYCVYGYGSDFYKKVIFSSSVDTQHTYTPKVSTFKSSISADTETSGSIANPYYNTITSNNLKDVQFSYVNESGATTYTAHLTDLKLRLNLVSPAYPQGDGTSCRGSSMFTGNYKILDNDGNVIDNFFIQDKIDVSFDLSGAGQLNDYEQNFTNNYFSFNIHVIVQGNPVIPHNQSIHLVPELSNITITAKNINTTSVTVGVRLEGMPAATARNTPNLYVAFKENKMSIAIDFTAYRGDPIQSSNENYRGIYRIERNAAGEIGSGIIYSKKYPYRVNGTIPVVRPPLREALIITEGRYMFTRLEKEPFDIYEEATVVHVHTIKLNDANEVILNHDASIFIHEGYRGDSYFLNRASFVFGDPVPYLLTNDYLFTYDNYTQDNDKYNAIKLLFRCFPIAYFYGGNTFDSMYIATENALYISNSSQVIEVTETTLGKTNFILPEVYALLENYYVGIGNKLYISKSVIDNGKFKWYFPDISVQPFDNDITNLQSISNNEVAIFFENEIWHSIFDAETVIDGKQGVYRYYKSKLQAGCKKGSDVLVTYDGKYTVFPSNRGLVAMSYQDFIASTEQSLTYLSDNVYDKFVNYITEKNSLNQIKLYKFGYWIVIYKRDSKDGFVFDTRNNSWWPLSSFDKPVKFVTVGNEIKMLSSGNIYELNKSDKDYYDYDGKLANKIPWLIKSQKLHLSALNNYKHIINMTFVSVHDSNILQNSEYNIDGLDFKLQANCYRKKVDGNINSLDDYVTVNYRVDTIRTYVQRLNYSKINEFQYQLTSDEENAFDIPLSLNSITIKYKIGGQVR